MIFQVLYSESANDSTATRILCLDLLSLLASSPSKGTLPRSQSCEMSEMSKSRSASTLWIPICRWLSFRVVLGSWFFSFLYTLIYSIYSLWLVLWVQWHAPLEHEGPGDGVDHAQGEANRAASNNQRRKADIANMCWTDLQSVNKVCWGSFPQSFATCVI